MIIFIMVFQFTLYPFSLMPWRRTAVMNPFVKMLNINYIHICSHICCWEMEAQTLCSDYTVLPFAKLSFLLRCVEAGFGFASVVFVHVQLLYQLRAVILQD